MTAIILAGGLGTRISEESILRPKPMVEIGGYPMLWHIMKIYYSQGVNNFIIAGGYKQEQIKEWVLNYPSYINDIKVEYNKNNTQISILTNKAESWAITVADTGLESQTGERIRRLYPYFAHEDFIYVTYGDGVADIDLRAQTNLYNQSSNALGLISIYKNTENKGIVTVGPHSKVVTFQEKPKEEGQDINIGFMIFNTDVFAPYSDYLPNDNCNLEKDILPLLAHSGNLLAYRHTNYWQCMDTINEKKILETAWATGKAPWKVW